MSNYKKILIGVISFCVLLVAFDFLIGTFSEKLFFKTKTSEYNLTYLMEESKDDVIILGSSRACHHYVPTILSDSLGYNCFNCGRDGMCIFYHYAILSSFINRKAIPKIVIYDIVDYDALEVNRSNFNLEAALSQFGPFYGKNNAIDSLFYLTGWKGKIKLMSKSYRYNSKITKIISGYLHNPDHNYGYKALYGITSVKDSLAEFKKTIHKEILDNTKISYVTKLVQLCKVNGIKLIICYSPLLKDSKAHGINAIKNIAMQNGITFLDYSNDSRLMKRKYFKDTHHLNDEGARLYSTIVAHDIAEVLFK